MDLIKHINRMKAFSQRAFGPGARPNGVCEHIRSELKEIEEDPNNLTEWCDVVLLALDGAWRQGFSAEEIAAALEAKQTKNEGRTWPDWRNYFDGEAIEHIPEPPAGCYPKGTILRYGPGPAALMRVDSISANHAGPGSHRYYGRLCMGGLCGVYHSEVKPANEEDLEIWRYKA